MPFAHWVFSSAERTSRKLQLQKEGCNECFSLGGRQIESKVHDEKKKERRYASAKRWTRIYESSVINCVFWTEGHLYAHQESATWKVGRVNEQMLRGNVFPWDFIFLLTICPKIAINSPSSFFCRLLQDDHSKWRQRGDWEEKKREDEENWKKVACGIKDCWLLNLPWITGVTFNWEFNA